MLIRQITPTTGGIKPLSSETKTDLTAAGLLFTSIPAGCLGVTMTIRGGITITFDGTTPVVDTHHALEPNIWTFQMETAELAKIKAIETTSGASVYTTFWGG
jgi:hypothetical protein